MLTLQAQLMSPQDMLGQGFSLLATGTDVGFMAEAAASNAAFVRKLRAQHEG
jgi:2-keto-3-deoxy-L-rhamnonate aldolase RhmA